MERRRQATLGGALQPLGGNQDRKPPWRSGLGEDLGSTSYKPAKSGRPKIVPNPRVVKAKEEEETQKGNSEVTSSISSDEYNGPDNSADPIDFISSQSSQDIRLRPKPRPPSAHTMPKRSAQPPPFGKSQSVKPPLEPKSTTAPSSSKPNIIRTTRISRKIIDPESDSSSSPATSRSKARRKEPSPPQPASRPPASEESESLSRKKAARVPEPPPFAGLGRTQNSVKEVEKSLASTSKQASPPPWKTSTSKGKLNNDALEKRLDLTGTEDYSQPESQISAIDSNMLKGLRIPRRNDKNPTVVAPVAAKEPLTEHKKKPAAFPMAAYAREAAAKQAVEDTIFRSPRKRFKPDEVERLLKRAEEDELMGVDDETLPHMDPNDLCPFCDEPLPDNPSPDLLQLLADLRATAAPEPRLRNPLGLTAPLMTFINLCQMHRAESTYVEQGRRNHWPSVIDWDDVRERLRSPRVVKALQEIIKDPHSSEFFVTLYNTIKRDGALKVASIRGQLDTFELSHPGYYGEQGLLVFFDTLNELFPNLTSEECSPLTTRQFFMSVLVPEAAALLIEQDMDCTHDEALITLRESRQYGLTMFPDRGGFFGSGKGDHMDEAGAKQLKWRKDMIAWSHSSNGTDKVRAPFSTNFLDEEADPDVLVVD